MTIDELRAEALRLDPGERAELASQLLVSLDDLSECQIEKLWIEEAMRRDAALDNGAPRHPCRRGLRSPKGKARVSLSVSFHEEARTEL